MGTPIQNGVVTVGNKETTSLRPDSPLGEFTKASKSRGSETKTTPESICQRQKMQSTPAQVGLVNILNNLYCNAESQSILDIRFTADDNISRK